jgi:autotransporter-associated beta strand protein
MALKRVLAIAARAGNANIITNSGGRTVFGGSSTAGNASILTRSGGRTDFFTLATGQASFVTEAGGIVDFSNAFGASFSHQISAGSIAGAGGYFLGVNALTVGSNGLSTTVDGVIADGGISGGAGASLIKIGAGTLVLSGINSYSGGTTVSAGTLQLAGVGTLGATSAALTVLGGVLDLNGTSQTTGAMTLNGGSVVGGTLTSSAFDVQTGTISAVLAGPGALTKTGGGAVALSGANSYTGGTTIYDGTLLLSGPGTLGNVANFTIVNSNSAVLDLGGSTQNQNGGVTLIAGTIQNGALSSSGTFDLRGGSVSAALTGNGALTKSTTGTVTLSAANTYTGGTSISAGTLEASHATAGAIDAFGTNNITMNGGMLRSTVSGQIANNIGFANGATSTFSAATANTVTTTGFLTFSDNSVARFGSATDTGTIVIGLPGGIFISSSSQLEVNGGTLRSGAGSSFLSSLTGANASTTIAAGATLDFNDQMSPALGGISKLLGSGLVVTGTNATTDLRIASGAFAGEIAGAGSVHVANFFPAVSNGTLLLTGANSYTGGTFVDANQQRRSAGAR